MPRKDAKLMMGLPPSLLVRPRDHALELSIAQRPPPALTKEVNGRVLVKDNKEGEKPTTIVNGGQPL
jgi:hypothetical protein